jgi:tRNA pseudouridine13 synthase
VRPAALPQPPELERQLGMASYLTTTPGIGGRLRAEVEDFQVIELGPPPRPRDGKYTAAHIRLRNWETNRFIQFAARELGMNAGQVAFRGMKDKRAVTEQWFTFPCRPERLQALDRLDDVTVLAQHATDERAYAGSHTGNRFIIRVRDAHADERAARVEATRDAIAAEGGVPNFFGPQRFGAGVRPVTHVVGRAIVAGDLEEAVRLYLGNPVEGEREEALAARRVYEETRDPAAALQVYPSSLDLERAMLHRLVGRPGDWRAALGALPHNLLQMFVHAHQSHIFNAVLSRRLAAGLSLRTAHVGDRIMADGEDGTRTHLVTPANQARVQAELDKGRAFLTAPLVGLQAELAGGDMGAIEAAVLDEWRVEPRAFRCRELPEVASEGRRRAILQPVGDLAVNWADGDPVLSFALGKGAYATVVLREFMKSSVDG